MAGHHREQCTYFKVWGAQDRATEKQCLSSHLPLIGHEQGGEGSSEHGHTLPEQVWALSPHISTCSGNMGFISHEELVQLRLSCA